MKRFVSILVIVGILTAVILAVCAYVALSAKQSQINNKALGLRNSLHATSDDYAKCFNSLNRSSYMINDVSLSYLRYDSSDSEKAKLDQIESEFMNDIKRMCEGKVSNYEKDYESLNSTIQESNQYAWTSFLIGGNRVSDNELMGLSPDYVRMNAGNPLTYFVFTEEDVEKYFSERI